MHIAKGLEPFLKKAALRLGARRRTGVGGRPLVTDHVRRVLVFRPERFGDMLATLPILRRLRAHFPHGHLTVWTSRQGREILAPEALADDIALFSGRARDRLRARRLPPFDLVFDLVMRDSVNSLLVCTQAARGGLLVGWGKENLRRYYDWSEPIGPSDEYGLYRGLGVLAAVGLPTHRDGCAPNYTDAERAWADSVLGGEPGPIVLNLSAHDRRRHWPAENWAALIAHLETRTDRAIRLNAIGADREDAERLARGRGPRVQCLPAGAPFRAVACFVSQAGLLVSPDTSLVHIAGPAGVPTVGLFPLRHEFRMTWIPPGTHVRVIHSTVEKTLRPIPVAAVLQAVDSLLEAYREPCATGS